MKFLKTLLVMNTFNIVPMPISGDGTIIDNNGNLNNYLDEGIVEIDSYWNLTSDIWSMMNDDKLPMEKDGKEIHFWRWINDGGQEGLNFLSLQMEPFYAKYVNKHRCIIKELYSEYETEREVEAFESKFENDSQNWQNWKTPGYQTKVTNTERYTLTETEAGEMGIKIQITFMGWFSLGYDYTVKNETIEERKVATTIEETEMFKPQTIKIPPFYGGKALYRVLESTGLYNGMFATTENKDFLLELPPFLDTNGNKIEGINLTAPQLLKGLEKVGYDLSLLGREAKQYSFISYDNRKPIEDVKSFTINLPMEWETTNHHIQLSYDEFPLKKNINREEN